MIILSQRRSLRHVLDVVKAIESLVEFLAFSFVSSFTVKNTMSESGHNGKCHWTKRVPYSHDPKKSVLNGAILGDHRYPDERGRSPRSRSRSRSPIRHESRYRSRSRSREPPYVYICCRWY